MATITTRAGKGSPLTNTEVDDNFTNLNTDKLETSGGTVAGSLTVTGTVTATTYTGALASTVTATTQSASDNSTKVATTAYVDTSSAAHDSLPEVLVVGNTTGGTDLAVSAGDDITFTDTSKAIFGAGSDLQIYHNSSHSYIQDTGTGNLYLGGSGLIALASGDFQELYATFNDDGAVTLRHDNGQKLATTSTGIDVTGTATMDGLTVDTSDQVIVNHSADGGGIRIDSTNDTNTGSLRFGDTADNYIGAVEYNHSTNTLSLYADNATRVAVSSTGIDVTGKVTATNILEASDGTNGEMQFGLGTALTTGAGTYDSSVRWNGSSGNLLFSQGAVEKMRITNTGIDVTGSVLADGLTVDGTAQLGTVSIYDNGTNATVVANSGHDLELRGRSGQNVNVYSNGAINTVFSSAGIDVTGTATMDGLTVDGDVSFDTNNAANPVVISRFGNTNESLSISVNDSMASFVSEQDETETTRYGGFEFIGRHAGTNRTRFKIDHTTGDISFYEDTGTTPKFFWDASAESLGIGGSTSISAIVSGDNNAPTFIAEDSLATSIALLRSDTSITSGNSFGSYAWYGTDTTSNLPRPLAAIQAISSGTHSAGDNPTDIRFLVTPDGTESLSEKMRIDGDGNVGIGTSAPDGTLHVYSGSAGSVTANANADDLVVENNGDAGISILSTDAEQSRVIFGSPSDDFAAALIWDYTSSEFKSGSSAVGASHVLAGDNLVTNLTLSGASGSELATFAGTATMDGLTVDNAGTIQLTKNTTAAGDSLGIIEFHDEDGSATADAGKFQLQAFRGNDKDAPDFKLIGSNSTGVLRDRILVEGNGDLSLYEDTGSTPKFFWDASTESLGIGNSSPQQVLHISQGVNATATTLRIENTDTTINSAEIPNAIEFYTNDTSTGGTGVSGKISQVCTNAGNSYALTFSTYNGGTLSESLQIANNGDVSFYDLAGTTAKFFWDSSAEALGIGTTTPASALEVIGEAVVGSGTDGVKLTYSGGNSTGIIDTAFDSTGLEFRVVNSEKMRLTATGLGIGTSSPIETFTVGATSSVAGFSLGYASTQIFLRYNNYYSGTTQVSDATKGTASISLGRGSDGVITFNTAAAGAGTPSERMRIDSSGNLFVGKSNVTESIEGVELRADGWLKAIRSSDYAATLRRNDSDGGILEFNKDGTTVGSIGSLSGDVYIGTGVAGVKFADANPSINPHNTTTNATADNSIDLGTSSARFKDLYLSGTVSSAGLVSTTLGTGNFVAGSTAGDSIIAGGNYNTLVGDNAGTAITTGDYNTALGRNALAANTTGISNIAIGGFALDANTTSNYSTAVGYQALGVSTGTKNTALGRDAGLDVTTGSNLTLIGHNAQPSSATATNEMTFGDTNVTLNRFNGSLEADGVYLGGTGAANKLDDYEEGTWTPTAADASSGGNTGTTGTGTYTKTGNTVRVTAALPNVVTTGMTAGNTFSVQGFPFGTGDIFGVTGIFTSCTVHTSAVTTSSAVWSLMVDNGITSTQFYDTGGAILVSDITSGSGDFYFTVVYQTA